MKEFSYRPQGVCSRRIDIVLNGEIVENVSFTGGCSGNTTGVAALCRGMNVREAIERLEGIRCGMKTTSCPDQLSRALRAALEESGKN